MVIQIDDKAGYVFGCGYSVIVKLLQHSDLSIMPACTLAVSGLLDVVLLLVYDPLAVGFQSMRVNLNMMSFFQRSVDVKDTSHLADQAT